MIYTSYYAKMRKFPENFIPVSISLGVPKWYKGAVYKELAPTGNILSAWKANHEKDESFWESWYDEQYKAQVLSKHSQVDIATELEKFLPKDYTGEFKATHIPVWSNPDIHVVLLCYEKSKDFCHRKLVSQWFERAGIPCREAMDADFEKQEEIEVDR